MPYARWSPVILTVICFLWGGTAWGAAVALQPVRVHLSAEKRSELIEITNNGSTPARFQARGNAWRQSIAGEMELVPTNDLIFFPSLLEIQPGETRRVRVATTTPAGTLERTYRLVLEEMPADERPGMVQVLTHLSIPVFVQPARPQPKPHVRARLDSGQALVSLTNKGNSYLKAQSVRLIARSSGGEVVHQENLDAWYVLAKDKRNYRIDLPQQACLQIASLYVAVQSDQGSASSTVEVSPGAFCGR